MAVRLLNRLAGLETEYVARFRPDARGKRPLTYHLLLRLVEQLKRRLPLVPADHPKKGFFLATGGAVWQERPGEGLDHPLIEGSTPECRGALRLLTYQRAQDALLASAAADVDGGEFTLCKSDCDANGNVYGSQENYDAIFAEGWRLQAWRVAVVVVLLPLILVGWAGVLGLVLGLAAYYLLAAFIYLAVLGIASLILRIRRRLRGETSAGQAKRDRARLFDFMAATALRLFGPWGGDLFRFMPKWVSRSPPSQNRSRSRR